MYNQLYEKSTTWLSTCSLELSCKSLCERVYVYYCMCVCVCVIISAPWGMSIWVLLKTLFYKFFLVFWLSRRKLAKATRQNRDKTCSYRQRKSGICLQLPSKPVSNGIFNSIIKDLFLTCHIPPSIGEEPVSLNPEILFVIVTLQVTDSFKVSCLNVSYIYSETPRYWPFSVIHTAVHRDS